MLLGIDHLLYFSRPSPLIFADATPSIRYITLPYHLLVIPVEDPDGQPCVAADLEPVLDAVQGCDLLVGQAPAIQLPVGLDARLGDTLGQHGEALLQTPDEQDLLGGLALGLGDGQEGLVLAERGVGAAEGRVGRGVDVLALEVLDELGRGVARVQLDLVDGGRDLCGLGGEQLLHVCDVEVGHADVLDLARVEQLLHLAPRVDEVPVGVVLLEVVRVRGAGPVHEVQVKVVGLQVLEGLVEALGDALVPRVVELGRQPNLGPGHARRLDAVTDFLLVAVGEGCVNVSVAILKSCLDGVLDLVGLGLPCSKAHGGDLGTRVQGVGLTGDVLVKFENRSKHGNGGRRGNSRGVLDGSHDS